MCSAFILCSVIRWGRETWQLARGFFHRRVSFFLVQFIEATAKRSACCQKSESTVSLLYSAKKNTTLKGQHHRLGGLCKDFFSLGFKGWKSKVRVLAGLVFPECVLRMWSYQYLFPVTALP